MVRLGSDPYDLERFVEAQADTYDDALAEIKAGRKRSHWMWFIFPQLKGLGSSSTSEYYGIENLAEAKAYLAHPVLGKRLVEMCEALLDLPGDDARAIFGSPDNRKLYSSMSLFAMGADDPDIFNRVLLRFFGSEYDPNTVRLLAG